MTNFLKKKWVYHSIIWLFGLVYFVIIEGEAFDSQNYFRIFIDPLSLLLPFMVITYIGFWIKAHFFDKRKYLTYFLLLALLIICGVLYFKIETFSDNPIFQDFVNVTFIVFTTLGLQYLKRGIVNQYQVQELKARTAETELNALKTQINPHFLFNTLNNIYGTNQIDPKKGSEMILELADVMRYHFEYAKKNQVRIKDEVQLLNAYIKLEQLRLTDNCDLKVILDPINESALIAPLLLLPFVENAFKHGTHPAKSCFIDIRLKHISNKLNFYIRNSVIENRKVIKTNIGLENTKKRLSLIYPNKHTLTIKEENNVFVVQLTIDI